MEKDQESSRAGSDRVETDLDRLEKLEKAERSEAEEELAKLAKARNLADAENIIDYAGKTKRLHLSTIGYHVDYCPLRIEDRLKVMEITDDNPDIQRNKRNRETVYLILSRADQKVWTKEKVYSLPANYVDAILYEYEEAEDSRFLLPILRRKSIGLRQTLTPKR